MYNKFNHVLGSYSQYQAVNTQVSNLNAMQTQSDIYEWRSNLEIIIAIMTEYEYRKKLKDTPLRAFENAVQKTFNWTMLVVPFMFQITIFLKNLYIFIAQSKGTVLRNSIPKRKPLHNYFIFYSTFASSKFVDPARVLSQSFLVNIHF